MLRFVVAVEEFAIEEQELSKEFPSDDTEEVDGLKKRIAKLEVEKSALLEKYDK